MNKKRLFTALALTAALHTSAYAYWIPDDAGWRWTGSENTVSQWQWIDGNYDGVYECYYFDENGYCMMDTVTPDGFQVNDAGAWVQDGQVQTQTRDLSAIGRGSVAVSQWVKDTLGNGVWDSGVHGQVVGDRAYDTASDGDKRYVYISHLGEQYAYLESTGEVIGVVLPLKRVVEGIDYKGFDTRQMAAALDASSMTPMKLAYVKNGRALPTIAPGGNTDPVCRFVLNNGYTLEIGCYVPFYESSRCLVYKTGGPLKTDSWYVKLE